MSKPKPKPKPKPTSVESTEPRNPPPGYEPLPAPDLGGEPRRADNPAYPVGTLLQAQAKSFLLDSEVVGIAWEQPKYEPDPANPGHKKIVRPGNQHLYRIRQLRNGINQIVTEADITQYFAWYKIPTDNQVNGE